MITNKILAEFVKTPQLSPTIRTKESPKNQKSATPETNEPKSIVELNDHTTRLFERQPEVEREIQIQMGSIVSQMYKSALESTEGYCYKFSLPLTAVHSFYKKLDLKPPTVEAAFRNDWKYPRNAHMYSD